MIKNSKIDFKGFFKRLIISIPEIVVLGVQALTGLISVLMIARVSPDVVSYIVAIVSYIVHFLSLSFKDFREKIQKEYYINELVDLTQTIQEGLFPLLEEIESLITTPKSQQENGMAKIIVRTANAVKHILPNRRSVRFILYQYEKDNNSQKETLRPIHYEGRVRDRPKTIHSGTPNADEIFRKLKNDDMPILFPKEEDDSETNNSEYATYIAIPLVTQTQIYGRFTVDSPRLGEFDKSDLEKLEILGKVLTVAFGVYNSETTLET